MTTVAHQDPTAQALEAVTFAMRALAVARRRLEALPCAGQEELPLPVPGAGEE